MFIRKIIQKYPIKTKNIRPFEVFCFQTKKQKLKNLYPWLRTGMSGGVVVRASDVQPTEPRGRSFESGPQSAPRINSEQVVDTHVPLFTKLYKLVPAYGWDGNRRSGVALAMRHRLRLWSTYEHPA